SCSSCSSAPPGRARRSPREDNMTDRLFHRTTQPADLLIRNVHALDPRADLDGPHDLLIRGGAIAEIGEPGTVEPAASTTETLQPAGVHAFPAFFDPHVHLRTPGQEYKESLETGTAAAAAGGFGAVIAMPNTDPVIDDASILNALTAAASVQARV